MPRFIFVVKVNAMRRSGARIALGMGLWPVVLLAGLVENSQDFGPRRPAEWAPTSVIVFPFDARPLQSSDLDHLRVSRLFHESLLRAFRDRTSLRVVPAGRRREVRSFLRLATLRGRGSRALEVPEYNHRRSGESAREETVTVMDADLHLAGTVEDYVPSGSPDDSYIKVTVRLADGSSKTVLWVTTMGGNLRAVANALADSVAAGRFRGPSAEEEAAARWRDPRSLRPKPVSWGWSVGAFLPVGQVARQVRPDAELVFDLDWSLPVLAPVRNRLSLGLVDRLRDRTGNGASHDLVPLAVVFLYDIPGMPVEAWRVYPKADVGVVASWLSFPGLAVQKNGQTDLFPFVGVGFGTEYTFPSYTAYSPPRIFFHLPSTAVVAEAGIRMTAFRQADFRTVFAPLVSLSLGLRVRI